MCDVWRNRQGAGNKGKQSGSVGSVFHTKLQALVYLGAVGLREKHAVCRQGKQAEASMRAGGAGFRQQP